MKIAKEKVWTDKAGNLVPDGDISAAILVAATGQKVLDSEIEKYESAPFFFDDPAPALIEDKNPLPVPLQPENLADTVSKLSGPGFANLRSQLSGQFGIRLESTGARQNSALTRIIFQTLDASPDNPYLVEFNQFILDPFTGAGQFDLVERDSSDVDIVDDEGVQVSGGESEVTLATEAGFTDGTTTGAWSRLAKVLTSDKVYIVVFVPGDAGDGIYSISARNLGISAQTENQ